MILTLILLGLGVLLLTGLPLFAGLGLASILIIWVVEGHTGGLGDVVFGSLSNYQLVAIPLFAFMAQIMIKAKVVDDLYAAAHVLVRHLPGGLGVATVLSCTVFAAISGSSVATALTIGASAIPQMRQYGYPARVAYGVVAAGGTLGILIPPSGPMVLYGVISDTSISALFIAGVVPGLMMAAIFAVFCMVQAALGKGLARMPRASLKECATAIRRAFWALILPPIVLVGMYAGVFTATEAAGVGAIAALLIATLAYRRFGWADFYESAHDTVRTSAMLFMILAAAAMFGHVVTILRLPAALLTTLTSLGVGPIEFILAVMLVIFILGMFLETISIILITTPIVLPVMQALQIDPIWYGVLLTINLELALITPPVGMNLFVIKGITQAPLWEIVAGVLPYVGLLILGLLIVLAFPELALWLPHTMAYGR